MFNSEQYLFNVSAWFMISNVHYLINYLTFSHCDIQHPFQMGICRNGTMRLREMFNLSREIQNVVYDFKCLHSEVYFYFHNDNCFLRKCQVVHCCLTRWFVFTFSSQQMPDIHDVKCSDSVPVVLNSRSHYLMNWLNTCQLLSFNIREIQKQTHFDIVSSLVVLE